MKYAVSDIHGCVKTFKALIQEKIQFDPANDELYLLGDYVDRGPDSKGVLDYILNMQQQGYSVHTIRGNHDQMMIDAFHGIHLNWVENEGRATMRSFGVLNPKEIPNNYFTLIEEMNLYIELEDYYLVHAGFDFTRKDPFSHSESMMTIRQMNIDNSIVQHKKIIHGHTPVPLNHIVDSVSSDSQTINIDNGCVMSNLNDYGSLIALELDSLKIHTQPFID